VKPLRVISTPPVDNEEKSIEWPFSALSGDSPVDEAYEELGYGTYWKKRLPTADEL
jgi:hypothetical protein